MSMLAAVHCGANFILHSAGFLDGLLSMSYEKFVMDTDFCGALHTYLDGVKVDDNQLALDAFREVGPGSHFFGCAHTMANYETAFWDSEIADNEPFEKWEAAGSEDAAIRANRRWKKALAEYEAPPLDEGDRRSAAGFHCAQKGVSGRCLVLSAKFAAQGVVGRIAPHRPAGHFSPQAGRRDAIAGLSPITSVVRLAKAETTADSLPACGERCPAGQ